jgi:hypothetical protein
MHYLMAASHKLVGLGEDVDWTKAPKPPAERTPEKLQAYANQLGAWQQSVSLDLERAPDVALQALGLSGTRGKSVYRQYRKAIETQEWARTINIARALRDRAKALGIQLEMPQEDPSNFSKKIRKGRASLARGKLEAEPGGPVHTRSMAGKLRQT